MRLLSSILLASLVAGAAVGCAPSASADGTIRIVTSTDVYGSIAAEVGGAFVTVDAIIDSPSKDPHEYQATGQDQLAISKAQLLVENGGGYDDFMDTMIAASGSTAPLLNVVELSGLPTTPAVGEFNEHVWYHVATMTVLADAIADSLATLDPSHAATFHANAATFGSGIADLQKRLTAIAAAHTGAGVAITEPVPLYLLEDAGLVNRTPAEFSEAVEADTDVPPAVLRAALDVITGGTVALLAYNEQTGGPQTDAVIAAAKEAGVPQVAFSESLPAGPDYLGWMSDNIGAVAQAMETAK